MLPNNFVGAVTLDGLGSAIPTRDASLRVQKHNRVVFDAVDQQAEVIGGEIVRQLAMRCLANHASVR